MSEMGCPVNCSCTTYGFRHRFSVSCTTLDGLNGKRRVRYCYIFLILPYVNGLATTSNSNSVQRFPLWMMPRYTCVFALPPPSTHTRSKEPYEVPAAHAVGQ